MVKSVNGLLFLLIIFGLGCIDEQSVGDVSKEVKSLRDIPVEMPLPTTSTPTAPPSIPTVSSPQSQAVIVQKLEKPVEYPKLDIPGLEGQVHTLINSERDKRGLKPLKWNEEVVEVARQHSQYLADLNTGFKTDLYIDHMDGNGTYHDTRLRKREVYYFFSSGENIHGSSIVKEYYAVGSRAYSYHSQDEMAENAVTGWMDSPGHKDNILASEYDEAGIGIAADSTGTIYIFTQVFIQRSECGYETGQCCQEPGQYPYCYVPLKCIENICEGYPDGTGGLTEPIVSIEERDYTIVSFFDPIDSQVLEGEVYLDYEYYGRTTHGDIRVYFKDIPNKEQLSPYIEPRISIRLKGQKDSNPFDVKWQLTKVELMSSDVTLIIN